MSHHHSNEYVKSLVYRQAFAKADSWCFYFDMVGCCTSFFFLNGWHTLIGHPIKRDIALYTSVCVAIRCIELRLPALYQRRRLLFLRLIRWLKLLATFAGLPTALRLHRHGQLVEHMATEAFSNRLSVLPVWTNVRIILMTGGACLGICGLERMLPFWDVAILHLTYLFILLAWMLNPAVQVLQLPSFAAGSKQICQYINTAAYAHPFLLFIPTETRATFVPDGCDNHSAQRVVLFSNILGVLLIPLYYMYRYEGSLKRQVTLALLSNQMQPTRAHLRELRPRPWWQQALIDTAAVAYMAVVTWRFVVDYEDAILGVFETCRLCVEAGLGYVTASLSSH